MSKYTTQLRYIIESVSQDIPNMTISQRIDTACPAIFNFNYPIWEESYRPILERKILMHYFNKEIGLETVGLWKLYLEEKLNLIMPYYNQLYETVIKDYDWLSNNNETEMYQSNKNMVEDGSSTLNGESKGNSRTNTTNNEDTLTTGHEMRNATSTNSRTSMETGKDSVVGNDTTNRSDTTENTSNDTGKETGTSQRLNSDLPQANYANLDYGTELIKDNNTVDRTNQNKTTGKVTGLTKTDTNSTTNRNNSVDENGKVIDDGTVDNTVDTSLKGNIDSISDDTSTTTQQAKNTKTNKINDDYMRKRTGASGIPLTDLLMKYRESLINIDMMIIDELQDLFMMIY